MTRDPPARSIRSHQKFWTRLARLARQGKARAAAAPLAPGSRAELRIDSMSITFVYTVLLMIILGLAMYLVYGRGRART